jgi:hypothetical protein
MAIQLLHTQINGVTDFLKSRVDDTYTLLSCLGILALFLILIASFSIKRLLLSVIIYLSHPIVVTYALLLCIHYLLYLTVVKF